MARARQGDTSALHQILERYQDRVLDRIRLMMGPQARQVAESGDFLQSVLLEMLRCFERYDVSDERGFLRLVTHIARNLIRSSVRRKREMAFASLSASTMLPDVDDHRSPPHEADWNHRIHVLAECLEQLSQDHRQVIELRSLDGLAFKDVGAAMNRSADAVQALYARALIRLGILARESMRSA
ncbi:MAG: sigma-70 family RNA polymerase sigma factor [Planctomycetota bacterium]